MLVLPVRFGGLGLTIPSTESDFCFEAPIKITAPIVALITLQDTDVPTATYLTKSIQSTIKKDKLDRQAKQAESIYYQLSASHHRLMDCSRENGASSWVTALPIDEHGFFLHKGALCDALCLRYGWKPSNLPLHCACGSPLSVDHTMVCHKGGFLTLRHNEIRDLTADLLKEVCPNTCMPYSHSVVNHSSYDLPTLRMVLVLTLEQAVFGPRHKRHFSMKGFLP